MPTTSPPTRLDGELYATAKVVGAISSRSAAQQLNHWARIGRELEASESVSTRDIAEVLARGRSYDTLAEREQAIVRADWAERIAQGRATLNLAQQFVAEGRSYAELDDQGNVAIVRQSVTEVNRSAPLRSRPARQRLTTITNASKRGAGKWRAPRAMNPPIRAVPNPVG